MPNTSIIEGEVSKKFNPVTKVKVNNSDTGVDVFDGKTYTVTVDSNENLVRTLVE